MLLNARSSSAAHPHRTKRSRAAAWLVPALLLLTTALAATSLLGDSLTYDETIHLTSGISFLETGDYRLTLGTPPAAQVWAALPLWATGTAWRSDVRGWHSSNVFEVGRAWFYELNDGEAMLPLARLMIVVLLVLLCWLTFNTARAVFGQRAALVTLALAALSPTLLAHGRLVTTDLPVALCFLLTIVSFDRVLEKISWGRVLAASASFALLLLVKHSGPLVLPALLAMAAGAVLRRRPIALHLPPILRGPRTLESRRVRIQALLCIALFFAGVSGCAIWTAYGWRFSPFAQGSRDSLRLAPSFTLSIEGLQDNVVGSWRSVLEDEDGSARRGVVEDLVRFARDRRLLPEAYLYGLAYTKQTAARRTAYLMGETSPDGWWSYFPVAVALKTPLPTLLLIASGVAALASGRARPRGDSTLLLGGLAVFLLVYSGVAIGGRLNVGLRHLVPVYPILFVLAGASAAWCGTRTGRLLISAALAWLLVANFSVYPHYLGYFNELVGGPANGHRYLADANLDWGQDLKRLAAYARERSDETIHVAYFGSADPRKYGFRAHLLPSSLGRGDAERLPAGIYALSVTRLLGIYEPLARKELWQSPDAQKRYRRYARLSRRPPPTDPEEHARWRQDVEHFHQLRWGRFVDRLRQRAPDARIGHSLWVYDLDEAEIAELKRS